MNKIDIAKKSIKEKCTSENIARNIIFVTRCSHFIRYFKDGRFIEFIDSCKKISHWDEIIAILIINDYPIEILETKVKTKFPANTRLNDTRSIMSRNYKNLR